MMQQQQQRRDTTASTLTGSRNLSDLRGQHYLHRSDDKQASPQAPHQVFIKITELTVPESPPRRDSQPLLVTMSANQLLSFVQNQTHFSLCYYAKSVMFLERNCTICTPTLMMPLYITSYDLDDCQKESQQSQTVCFSLPAGTETGLQAWQSTGVPQSGL